MKREKASIGILLGNLGTPDAPTPAALKRYLRQFLSDPRVIDLPRWKWLPILELFVLPARAPRSARAYGKIWTREGSPLLAISRRQREKLEAALVARLARPVHVALGMRYGSPSLASALEELRDCARVLLFPLYPQYAAATTASTFDAVADALRRRRALPELRTVRSYHDDPLYVRALAATVREAWRDGGPERLLVSFHGIPCRYAEAGDPYPRQCEETARLLAAELRFSRFTVAFQSRFGREEWLKPYADETLRAWGREGVKSVDVICPGFAADCLETLEEIDQLYRRIFEGAGGGRFRYIPALNDRDDHVEALAEIAARNLAGWE